MTKVTSSTIKRGNSYVTEYRLISTWIDTYTKVSTLIAELNGYVDMFPEELRADVTIDMDEDSNYATFTASCPASKEDTAKAKAKDAKAKQDWLDRAVKQRAELDAKIAQVSKEV